MRTSSRRRRIAQQYGAEYFTHHCGPIPYDRRHLHWLEFFGKIADEIIRSLRPRRVLDVGCAKGFLVECLRDRGVEAYGFDVSEYAINQVRPDIRRYCWVASATEPIRGRYDLVTCIEVLEHLPEPNARKAIKNMASHAPALLFSSTPKDFAEPTHINVRPVIEWLRLFRDVSFAPDVAFDASFISPQAMLLRKIETEPAEDLLTIFALAVNQKVTLQERSSEVCALKDESVRQTTEIERLADALRGTEQERDSSRAAVGDHEARQAAREAELQRLTAVLAEREARVQEQHEQTSQLWREVEQLRAHMAHAQAEAAARIGRLESQLREAEREQERLRAAVGDHEARQAAREAELQRLTAALKEKEAQVRSLDAALAAKDAYTANLEERRGQLGEAFAAERTHVIQLTAERERLAHEAEQLQATVQVQQQALGEKEEQIAQLRDLQSQLATFQISGEAKDKVIANLTFHLLAAQRTIGWKLLERLRRLRDRLLPHDSRRRKAYWIFHRVVEVLLDEGLVACLRKTACKLRLIWKGERIVVSRPAQEVQQDVQPDPNAQYQVWLERHRLNPQDVATMKAAVDTFTYTPLISIVVPVYDTDEIWLRKAIESIRAQIYSHWELCLANDGSTKPHVRTILEEYATIDPRVRVKHLPRNEGIVGASAHAVSLATGEFVGLLDHDDELPPDALFEVVKRLNENPELDLLYSDEDKLEPHGSRVEPFFKPDWSPDLLLSMNYVNHFSVFRRSLLDEIGGFRHGFDGSQDYDLLLRFTERTTRIAHIPKILYHWRKTPNSAATSTTAKPYAYEAAKRALEHALQRRGYPGLVESLFPGHYRVRYQLRGKPLVSILVPTRDRWQLLQQCLHSIEEKTSYSRYEIILLDNDSTEPETLEYLEALTGKRRVYRYPGPFNFSAINNFGAARVRGEYLLFLNNDTQVIEPDWLTAMLEQAQRPEVGAVGAKLLYPDGRIQHAGVVLGIAGTANHAFRHHPGDALGYFGLTDLVRNCSAVTAACMMVSRHVFKEVGGFDERFRIAFGDVDFCLRLRQRGYLIVYTPLALLYHYESATRGGLHPPEDEELCRKLWGDLIEAGDPYYNPNLTLSREDWSLRL